MNDQRLPVDRLPKTSLPFPSATAHEGKARAEERFTDEEMADIKRDFSLRFASLFRGMNNSEIGRRLRTSDVVVKNYIEGERLPNAELLLEIARVTGVNLHWLMTGVGEKRVEMENVFADEEEEKIQDLATAAGRSFTEEVRALTLGAVELLKKVEG